MDEEIIIAPKKEILLAQISLNSVLLHYKKSAVNAFLPLTPLARRGLDEMIAELESFIYKLHVVTGHPIRESFDELTDEDFMFTKPS